LGAPPNRTSAAAAEREGSTWKNTALALSAIHSHARCEPPSRPRSWMRHVVSSPCCTRAAFTWPRMAVQSGANKGSKRGSAPQIVPADVARPWCVIQVTT